MSNIIERDFTDRADVSLAVENASRGYYRELTHADLVERLISSDTDLMHERLANAKLQIESSSLSFQKFIYEAVFLVVGLTLAAYWITKALGL